MEYRDIIRKQEKKLDKKLDRRDFIKAVITDALGNTTGAGDIWYDRNTRRIWIQENGSASLSQVPCYKITPAIGLGVIVGYEPYSTIREVLATDREFYGPTNSTGTSYESPSNEDMLPGGRLQLWLDSRLLQPLAVYPADNLNINVVEGSYPYNGARKSFAGQINYDLSAYQPAGPNEHCLVGLYLDASNNLQVVAGATVSTAVTAPEPSWPSGSFLLAAVDLDDTQTSLSLADDIQDRRMAWSDEKTAPIDAQYLTLATNSVLTQERVFTPSLPLSGSDGGAGNPYTLSVGAASEAASGVAELATQAETNTGTDDARIVTPLKLANWTGAKSGWPVAGKAMINNVEYDTVQLAIDAMAAGDIIKVGQGTDAGGIVPDTVGAIVGLSPVETIITASANNSITVDNSAGTDNLTLENLTISNTGAGTSVACIQSNKDGLRLDNLDIKKVSGTPTNSTGVSVYGGSGTGTYLLNCRISVTTGTNKYGVYTSTAASVVVIEGGEINAATADIYIGHASAVVELRGPKLSGGGINNAAGGTVKGWYVDAYGRIVRIKPIGINNVRLTLTSGTPVTTADVIAATTIYAALYKGDTIEVFNGAGWIEAPFAELSLSLSGFTADKNSDVWIYDNAGTLALERTEWTNDTTRATALTTQDGRYVKTGATTRLYLGTFRTTSTTGQCEDSVTHRYVWNYYNRCARRCIVFEGTAHTYNTGTWRAWNNNQANADFEFVIGVIENAIDFHLSAGFGARVSTDGNPGVSIGLNTTTGSSSNEALFWGILGFGNLGFSDTLLPRLGYNYACVVEYTFAGATAPTLNNVNLSAHIWG